MPLGGDPSNHCSNYTWNCLKGTTILWGELKSKRVQQADQGKRARMLLKKPIVIKQLCFLSLSCWTTNPQVLAIALEDLQWSGKCQACSNNTCKHPHTHSWQHPHSPIPLLGTWPITANKDRLGTRLTSPNFHVPVHYQEVVCLLDETKTRANEVKEQLIGIQKQQTANKIRWGCGSALTKIAISHKHCTWCQWKSCGRQWKPLSL